ncbi:MAG: class I SAM-dependent methyltransferase [Calditrichaeota bacterium]|nr:class I SAM-dependent methyltransferase [Calditrichota bacterium]
MRRMRRLRLLPVGSLVKTGRVDHADWNYRPLLGFVQRQRFKLCRRLMAPLASGRVLEVGYGSGVFLPELHRHSRSLFGADVHPFASAVAAVLREHQIKAHLVQASAERLPFKDGCFDLLVSISALEFVPDLVSACAELRRVLKPSGALVVVTPGASRVIDFGFKLLTGEDPQVDFGDARQRVRQTLLRYFAIDKELRFPPLVGRSLCLYRALRLRPAVAVCPAEKTHSAPNAAPPVLAYGRP